jgi:hypothetical protein
VEKDSHPESLSVPETARHPLDHLNVEIPCFKHGIVDLQSDRVHDSPEIRADHLANFDNRLKFAPADPP